MFSHYIGQVSATAILLQDVIVNDMSLFSDQPLPPEEERELKETLQEIIGQGKKVKLEQKVSTGQRPLFVFILWLYFIYYFVSFVYNFELFALQINTSILGGLMVEFGEKVFDMSIRTRARQMERFLREPIDIGNLWKPISERPFFPFVFASVSVSLEASRRKRLFFFI